ncbi:MAG: coenzyme F420-0:L-glutamate ligase [Sphingomonadales bacterium]
MNSPARMCLTALAGLPLVRPGDDLAALIVDALAGNGETLAAGDVLVVAQKIVSKAEGRLVRLADVTVTDEARALAAKVGKDPRLVSLILAESAAVIRAVKGVLIVAHKRGYVHANAGIDQSNIGADDAALLLPQDPDASAARLRAALRARTGADVAIIINDSAGRAWRLGVCGFALGSAGLTALDDQIGNADLFGRPLAVTQVAVADELAAAASHLMGQAGEGAPVVLVRGARFSASDAGADMLLRPPAEDLFRA